MKPHLLLALLALAPLTLPAQPAPKPFTLPAGIRMERDLAYIPDGDAAQRQVLTRSGIDSAVDRDGLGRIVRRLADIYIAVNAPADGDTACPDGNCVVLRDCAAARLLCRLTAF